MGDIRTMLSFILARYMIRLSSSHVLRNIGNYEDNICISFCHHISNMFVIDPTPTVAEDMSDKTIERYLYNTISLDNNNNDNYNNNQKKNTDANHYCPKCNSHSLSFEGLDSSEGNDSLDKL